MTEQFKIGSLFDGSGGFPLAALLCGGSPAWASEVEPYPIAVTHSRFSSMKHLGDVAKINGSEIEPVDVITFGSPCQDMSVAGKREGIKHSAQGDKETTRSGLFYEATRIIREMRKATNGRYPRYAVWENVPGAFSSNKGRDFHAVLEALCSICDNTVSIPKPTDRRKPAKLVWLGAGEIVGDNYSVCWRTLDAQYWGVPQRRKRVYLVADFNTQCAREVLFKPEGMRGNMPQGDEKGKGVAADVVGSSDGSIGTECLISSALISLHLTQDPISMTNFSPCISSGNSEHGQASIGVCIPTIALHDQITRFSGKRGDRQDGKGNGLGVGEDIGYTLTDGDRHAVCYQNTGRGWWNQSETAETLRTPSGGDATKANLVSMCYDARGNGKGVLAPTLTGDHQNRITDYAALAIQKTYQEKSGPLMANSHPGSYTGQDAFSDMLVAGESVNPPRRYIIRRLMPVECARLQGFPDWWSELAPYDPADAEFWEEVRTTYAEINGKKYRPVKDLKKWYDKLHTDSAEYKMWGNGIALPCAVYVFQGIAEIIGQEGIE